MHEYAVGCCSRRPPTGVPVQVSALGPGPGESLCLVPECWALSGGGTWDATDLPSASRRSLLSLRETLAGEALPHLPPAQQLVLHLPEAHLPVPGGPGEPLFR